MCRVSQIRSHMVQFLQVIYGPISQGACRVSLRYIHAVVMHVGSNLGPIISSHPPLTSLLGCRMHAKPLMHVYYSVS